MFPIPNKKREIIITLVSLKLKFTNFFLEFGINNEVIHTVNTKTITIKF